MSGEAPDTARSSPPGEDAQRDWTVGELLAWTSDRLERAGVEQARVDAEHLLAAALQCSRMNLYVDHDRLLDASERAPFRDMVKRRLAREPVAYILGSRGFHALGLELAVDPRVLVPRPETEHLVDWLLEDLRPAPAPPMSVLDVGTGSGAIALAIRRARQDVTLVGVDASLDAVEVARENASRLQLDVRFDVADLTRGLARTVGGGHAAVAANLPYIARGDLDGLAPEVSRYEPRLALDGGEDGLDLVRALIDQAHELLAPRGALYLEVGAGQAETVAGLLQAAGLVEVGYRADYAGIPRVVRGRGP